MDVVPKLEFSITTTTNLSTKPTSSSPSPLKRSRYENQKRRDWNTFGQYLRDHRPGLTPSRCSGAHIVEFLRYLDQFGNTKVHTQLCPFFGNPKPTKHCPCPVGQAWGSLDAFVGRLRAAYEENGGHYDTNPFGALSVRHYLRQVRDYQSKSRGVSYDKKKRKQPPPPPPLQPSPPPLSSSSGQDTKPDLQDIKPDLQETKPELQDVKPDLQDIKPDLQGVKPGPLETSLAGSEP